MANMKNINETLDDFLSEETLNKIFDILGDDYSDLEKKIFIIAIGRGVGSIRRELSWKTLVPGTFDTTEVTRT